MAAVDDCFFSVEQMIEDTVLISKLGDSGEIE
jgi:hypothetical protein